MTNDRRSCRSLQSVSITRRLLLTAILLGLVSTAIETAFASPSSKMRHDIGLLGRSIEAYRDDTGSYPSSESESSWYDKLVLAGWLESSSYPTVDSPFGRIPLDMFGGPFIYEPPTNNLAMKAGTKPAFVLRSMGPNGIDNLGHLDDWEFSRGPRWGHWYKKYWFHGLAVALVGVVFAVGIYIVHKKRLRRMTGGTALSVLSTCMIGMTLAAVLPRLIDPYLFTASHRLSETWRWPVRGSAVGLPILGVVLITCVVYWNRKRIAARRMDRCARCGYDLHGASHARCPECGEPI